MVSILLGVGGGGEVSLALTTMDQLLPGSDLTFALKGY